MTGTANYDVILKQQGKNNKSCSSFSVSMTSVSVYSVSKLVLHFGLFILVYLMAFCGFYICSRFYLNFTLVIDSSISTALTLFLHLLVSRDMLCSSLHEVDLQVFPSKLGWLLSPFPIFKGDVDRVITWSTPKWLLQGHVAVMFFQVYKLAWVNGIKIHTGDRIVVWFWKDAGSTAQWWRTFLYLSFRFHLLL